MKVLFVLFAVLVCSIFATPSYAHTPYLDPDASALASNIVGYPISVYCTTPNGLGGGSAGAISVDGGKTWTWGSSFALNDYLCVALNRLIHFREHAKHYWLTNHDNGANNRLQVGTALLDITHESMHIKLQQFDEGVTECTAYRNLWPTIAQLKLPAWLAREMLSASNTAHTMQDLVDPRDGTPNPYRSGC